MSGFRSSKIFKRPHYLLPEEYTTLALLGLNFIPMLMSKDARPAVRNIVLSHFRTSIEALSEGRYYTILTSVFSHWSLWHFASNFGLLLFFRNVVPLSAFETIVLYTCGGMAGALTHLAWYWYDAKGQEMGLKYAVHTPAYMGASAGVAAILQYKLMLNPGAMQYILFVPVPLIFVDFGFITLTVMEKEYRDSYIAKTGGLLFGFAFALVQMYFFKRTAAIWR